MQYLKECFYRCLVEKKQMARQLRQTSCSGIYHVMVRGVNKQNIFDEEEDYR